VVQTQNNYPTCAHLYFNCPQPPLKTQPMSFLPRSESTESWTQGRKFIAYDRSLLSVFFIRTQSYSSMYFIYTIYGNLRVIYRHNYRCLNRFISRLCVYCSQARNLHPEGIIRKTLHVSLYYPLSQIECCLKGCFTYP